MGKETDVDIAGSSPGTPDMSGDKAGDGTKSVGSDIAESRNITPVDEEDENGVENGSDGSDAENKNNSQEVMDLTEDAHSLKEELDKITVNLPTNMVEPPEVFDAADFPQSYRENTSKENVALAIAENFRRQYVHLYRDRKPLFLNPVNECDVKKFVCTTIRPTQVCYKELYNWDGAAEFVADYLNYVPLEPAHELPERLLSPTTTLKRQKGNCFEYSTLLASLLIGVGYDAYVVSGYASRETCYMDETREICPMMKKKVKAKEEAEKKKMEKYTVKPPKDLRSKFELKMVKRKEKEAEDAAEKLRLEEEQKQEELEQPPPDPLHGLRVHSWVLVLEGKREVPESFFIEPLTGLAQSITSDQYLGIESVWSHSNYWVNMQDCSEGVKKLRYDLGDCTIWEYMFASDEKPKLQLPGDELGEDFDEEDEEEEDDANKKTFDMPPSWVERIELSQTDFQMRCPQGKKTKLYRRAKLEKFAHYLMKDGLVSRLSMYEDKDLTDLVTVKEFYANRADKLLERVYNKRTGWITEYYAPGRQKSLKEHHYRAGDVGPENERTMVYYDQARVDGLQKRVESPTDMAEHFTGRDDHLFFRSVEFGKRAKKFGPAEGVTQRPIVKMVERYHRNVEKRANDDIAELVFLVAEEKIQLTYHTDVTKISSSNREFLKPANADEKGATVVWHPENHVAFQVGLSKEDRKKVELYQMMCELLKAEDQCREKVRQSEEEVLKILNERTREEVACDLEISVYDTGRNEKAKKHRAELEQQEAEEKRRRQEMELDYLAPFLAQVGDPERLDRQLALKLMDDCRADLKQRLIDKANLIQARFEKETQELQKKQSWYQQNQVSMQKDDEAEYLNYCSEAMFRIHILELRLNRHKSMAPQKYMTLDRRIREDPRLIDFLV